jgi:hypothetical protein
MTSRLTMFSDEVISDVDVLRSCVELIVLGKIDDSLVVGAQLHRVREFV